VSAPQDPATEGASADHSRSGEDVVEAVEVAERGSSVQEAHVRPQDSKPGEAPVEQAAGDPAMTEGQDVADEGQPGRARSVGLDPEAGSSGAAQSHPGARVSDRVAAGETPPPDPSAG
jgi:hypothetical protein